MTATRNPERKARLAVLLATGALTVACSAPAVPGECPLAVGIPLGEEPEGWGDLREVPFEIHLGPPSENGSATGRPVIPLELRPGGIVIRDFDGTRALPFGLYREGTRGYNDIPVVLGSGARVSAVSPYRGWESALPLEVPASPGETTVREVVLEVDFLRLIDSRDREVALSSDGVLDPAPPPMGGYMEAQPAALVHDGAPTLLERWAPFDPFTDLWQGRDAHRRRIRWTGSSLGGGSFTSQFEVWATHGERIAYPVEMRFREPLRWTRRTYRFVLRDLPLPR